MGSKHRNTDRAKQQAQLDEFRGQLVAWYIDDRLTVTDIQQKLSSMGMLVTIGQVTFALRRFDAIRSRNVRSVRHLASMQRRKHFDRDCSHCGTVFTPSSGRQMFCVGCVPNSTFSVRIKKYGVGKREFDVMLIDQRGTCAICGDALAADAAMVDHDHATMHVRGLLCRRCNFQLGIVENVEFVVRAQAYLEICRKK